MIQSLDIGAIGSNEIYTFISGRSALQPMRCYLKNEKAKGNKQYFPTIVGIEEVLQSTHFYQFLLISASETSIDLKAFNRSGRWAGKCAYLSDKIHQASIQLNLLQSIPIDT